MRQGCAVFGSKVTGAKRQEIRRLICLGYGFGFLYNSTLLASASEEDKILTVVYMFQHFLPDSILEVAEMLGHINE